MVKLEVFYNGTVDQETPVKAEQLKKKYGRGVDLYIIDISEDTAPEAYGTINPPIVVVDEKQVFKLEGPDALTGIVRHVIF